MKSKVFSLILSIALFAMYQSSIAVSDQWQELSPFYTTYVTALAKHPNGKLYAATLNEGLNVSSDHGNTWKCCFLKHTNIIAGQIFELAIDSTGIIYIETDRESIWKSTDDGNTWTKCIFAADSEGIFSLRTDNAGNLYVGTKYGLYRTTDQGTSWKKILDTTNYYIVRDIAVQDGIIYALVDQFGLFKSKDNGNTWTHITFSSGMFNWSLLVINENEIYVAMTGFSFLYQNSGLIKTTDGGKNWFPMTNGITSNYISKVVKGSNNSILAGGVLGKIFKSTDSGNSWQLLMSGMTAGGTTAIMTDGERIISGNQFGGIISSNDNGNTWNFANASFRRAMLYTTVNVDADDFLIANEAGLFQYNVSSQQYTSLNGFNEDDFTASCLFCDYGGFDVNGIIKIDDNRYLISTYQGLLLKSDDRGKNWHILNTSYNFEQITYFSKTKTNRIYLCSLNRDKGLFKSDDYGNTWDRVRYDFSYCQSMCYDNQGNLFTGNLKWLYKSTDDGSKWYLIRDFGSQIRSIVQISDGTLLLLTQSNGIFRSSDDGTSWIQTELQDKISGRYLTTLNCNRVIEPEDGKLLLATQMGIYQSDNSGISWEKVEDEFSKSNVKGISYLGNGQIFAVADSGMFIKSYLTTSVDNSIKYIGFKLDQNYPNPFNPSTVINFSIHKASFVQLKIFDVLGKEVDVLVNEEKIAGEYQIKFDGSKLSSGVYLYQLRAGDFIETKKMIFMK